MIPTTRTSHPLSEEAKAYLASRPDLSPREAQRMLFRKFGWGGSPSSVQSFRRRHAAKLEEKAS